MNFGPVGVLQIATCLRSGEQSETLRKSEAVFHEQVANWNLCADASRWTSVGPVVGALVLHGTVALLLGGTHSVAPHLAARPDVFQQALVDVITLPEEAGEALVASASRATEDAVRPLPAPSVARAKSAVAPPSAREVETDASEASTPIDQQPSESTSVQGAHSGAAGAGSLGTNASGWGVQRGDAQGAPRSRQASVGKALSARLVPASLRCADLFPYAARSDQEILAVEVAVSPKGNARGSRIVSGHAHEAVFDAAALACARRLQFVPAQNTRGAEIEDRAVVRLRFERAS